MPHKMHFPPATSLCLACASSLPDAPPARARLFRTACCARPICAACLARNPRLARYSPCLSCLGGVGVVGAHAAGERTGVDEQKVNIGGAVRDADLFILGDDEEDDADGDHTCANPGRAAPARPPAYSAASFDAPHSAPASADRTPPLTSDGTSGCSASGTPPLQSDGTSGGSAVPNKYYIQKGDTIHGIALKFGLDGRTLCRLNNLPASTLSTTPHLLHTRTSLTLPATAAARSAGPSAEEARSHDAQRARERAERRFQTATKEADWRVARAYVALADAPDAEDVAKYKEMGVGAGAGGAAARAVDQYLEDEDWEARERAAGRRGPPRSVGSGLWRGKG